MPPPPSPQQPPRAMVAALAESNEALEVLRHTEEMLDRFGVAWATSVVHDVERVVPELQAGGVEVFIVADTSRTPLSTRVAELTMRPVLAVPVSTADLPPLDALRSTLTEGRGPVGSLAIGKAGAINAALLAIAILANADTELRQKLRRFREEQTEQVLNDRLE